MAAIAATPRIRSIAVGFVFLLVGLAAAVYFGPQTSEYFQMRQIDSFGLQAVPKVLSEMSISNAPGTTLSYYGYKFEVPWEGIEKHDVQGNQSHQRYVSVKFKNGRQVTFTDPDDSQDDPLRNAAHWESDTYYRAFGSEPTGSRYEREKAVLSMTPSQLSPFRSHRSFARDRIYLVSKGLSFEHAHDLDIFSFTTSRYRGFETIVSSGREQSVWISLFDEHDRRLVIAISADISSPRITQAEANRVIRTLATTQ